MSVEVDAESGAGWLAVSVNSIGLGHRETLSEVAGLDPGRSATVSEIETWDAADSAAPMSVALPCVQGWGSVHDGQRETDPAWEYSLPWAFHSCWTAAGVGLHHK